MHGLWSMHVHGVAGLLLPVSRRLYKLKARSVITTYFNKQTTQAKGNLEKSTVLRLVKYDDLQICSFVGTIIQRRVHI